VHGRFSQNYGVEIVHINSMEQLSFFPESGQSKGLPTELLDYRPNIFTAEESEYLMRKFIAEMPWQQRVMKMYDKMVLTPRLTVWVGDPGTDYSFSGEKHDPLPWTDDLLMMRNRIEPLDGTKFNSVLLNYYRDGNDSVAWHSDNENALGKHPVVASVTLGQVRSFDIRNKKDHTEKYSVKLESGSYLLMKGGLQEEWEHRIAKSTKVMKERVNLTFRIIEHGN
jgi:alkylated DNA repair dioxygenase AlkB